MNVSFVIPTYRETTFMSALDRLVAYLLTTDYSHFDIHVVDDSDDAGFAALEKELAARDDRPRIDVRLSRGPRRGKGAAVKMGALAATGDVVFTLDADLPVPLPYIAEFVERIRGGTDVVIAERDARRYAGNYVRHVLSRGLLVMQRTLVFHRAIFEDTQCGFKAFRPEILRELARSQIVEGGMYDLEYLYVASNAGLRVERVSVETCAEVRASRINLLRCIVYDPIDILRFKVRGMMGYYEHRDE